jgi:hypothetical protein
MKTQTNPRKKQTQRKFGVVPWRDYHGVETLFLVVDGDGHQLGIPFPSEWEAEAAAAKAAEEKAAS